MNPISLRRSILLLSFILALTACGGEEPTPTPEPAETAVSAATATTPPDTPTAGVPLISNAAVDSIEVLILESFPVQVNVRARGDLPNGCTNINNVDVNQAGSQYNVTITTIQEPDQACTEALVPFEELIPLDVTGLPAGTYTVNVNGIGGSFTLDVDNVPGAAPAETATPAADSNQALVNGRVWHDLCAVAEGEGDDPDAPSEGCIAVGDSFAANGLLDDSEPGIPNVTVNLGEGACPSAGLATATTDEDGDYVFTDLPAGDFCISIDAEENGNADLLLPGSWTFPEDAGAAADVTLEDGAVITGVNFGWDYQFLPAPEVDLATCTNSIEFVEDLSIPDDTQFAPGSEFEKSWRLRNDGTCPWTTDYSVAYVGGDAIPGPESTPLTETVVPGQTIDVSVTLTAPDAFGTYRNNYQLANANGEPFGIGGLESEAFWVQIEVGEAPATPVPNSGTIGGVIWEDFCSVNADGNPSAGCEEIEDTGFYRADGTLNFNEARLSDITVTLTEGACNDDGSINTSAILETTTTDAQGLYRFTNLNGGTYCVAINAFADANVDLLIPGDWTWPFYGVGQQGVLLDEGEELLEIDFGWEYDE